MGSKKIFVFCHELRVEKRKIFLYVILVLYFTYKLGEMIPFENRIYMKETV